MLLTELAEQFITILQSTPEAYWGSGLKVGTQPNQVPASNKVNPLECFEKPIQGVYAIPMVVEYDIPNSDGRGEIHKVMENPIVQLIISIPYTELDPGDVTTWNQSKKYINFRQLVERRLIGELKNIKDVQPAPPLELQGNELRYFMITTDFIFEHGACVASSVESFPLTRSPDGSNLKRGSLFRPRGGFIRWLSNTV